MIAVYPIFVFAGAFLLSLTGVSLLSNSVNSSSSVQKFQRFGERSGYSSYFWQKSRDSQSANNAYLDMGQLPWEPNYWDSNCIDWNTNLASWDCFSSLYSPVFVNLKNSGGDRVFFAFSQISDIL